MAEARARIHQIVIRESRIYGTRRHVPAPANEIIMHSSDPYHCVCNGTHNSLRWCPRCPD